MSGVDETEALIEELADRFTTAQCLDAIRLLAKEVPVAMAVVVTKLEKRRRDVEELLSIAKSAQELHRKLERMAERLLAEQGETKT